VTFVGEHGDLDEVTIYEGQGFHIPPGAPHRVEAVVDTIMYEASTPHIGDRVSDEHLLDG